MRRTVPILCLLLVGSGCGGHSEGGFGAPREVDSSRRNLVWESTLQERLGLREMGPAKTGEGAGRQSGSITADTPAGWQRRPAEPRRFRHAVWHVGGDADVECYLTLGVGGGVATNLSRWYAQQFGQQVPEVTSLPEIPFAGRTGRLCELEGTTDGVSGRGCLVAFFADGDQITSLKFVAAAEVVREQRTAFLSLAASLRIGGPADAAGGDDAPDDDAGEAAAAAGAGTPATSPSIALVATAPDGWTAMADSRRLLHHRVGDGGEVYVSQLGGTLRQSLDIWRDEIQVDGAAIGKLEDPAFEALPRVEMLGDDAVLMELRGRYLGMTGPRIDDAVLMVAAREDAGTITFCKLVAPRAVGDAERDAFLAFCRSLRRRS